MNIATAYRFGYEKMKAGATGPLVGGTVSPRIYPSGAAPSGAIFPYVEMTPVYNEDIAVLEGRRFMGEVLLQVTVWNRYPGNVDLTSQATIADAITTDLDGTQGTVTGGTVLFSSRIREVAPPPERVAGVVDYQLGGEFRLWNQA